MRQPSNRVMVILATFLVLAVAGTSSSTVLAGSPRLVDVTDEQLTFYLSRHQAMQQFMARLEGQATPGSADPNLPAAFEREVGVSYGTYMRLHSTVATAFAEAVAERSRQSQLARLQETIAELQAKLDDPATPEELRNGLRSEVLDLESRTFDLQEPVPLAAGVSAITRQTVRQRLDEVELAYTQQLLPEDEEGPFTDTPPQSHPLPEEGR